MNKMSATKISILLVSILLVSILSCLILFSCVDPNNTNNEEDTPSKEDLWSSMKGTWVCEETTDARYDYLDYPNIVIDDTEIDWGQIFDIKYEGISTISELKEISNSDTALLEALSLYQPHFEEYDLCYYEAYEKFSMFGTQVRIFYSFKILNNKLYRLEYHYSFLVFAGEEDSLECYQTIYKLNPSSSSDDTDDNNTETSITESDITGSYTISEANGSTFTFSSDGTWTYKYNSSTTNGTWSVSDGELTITYSLGGYSSTAVFTASISGDTYTLTGKSGDYTTIISSAFKITDQEALENGVVTLVKQ